MTDDATRALPDEAREAQAAPSGRGRSLAAVVSTAAIFGLTYGLTAPLIAVNLAERGASESLIGLNAAMHAIGVLGIATALPRVARRSARVDSSSQRSSRAR